MVYWLSLIYFSLKTPLKSQTVNLKPMNAQQSSKNNKGYHRQIRRAEKLIACGNVCIIQWVGNSNRTTQLKPCGGQDRREELVSLQVGRYSSHRVSRSDSWGLPCQRTVKGKLGHAAFLLGLGWVRFWLIRLGHSFCKCSLHKVIV